VVVRLAWPAPVRISHRTHCPSACLGRPISIGNESSMVMEARQMLNMAMSKEVLPRMTLTARPECLGPK
jgi:hypothetical protein